MKFSILIAHFNNSVFFKDCYQSIVNQTFANWEAIVLDDGSEEHEKLAVQKLIANDPRFQYYENEKNSGVGFTKAKLIELATGEICGFLDPDDALTETAIETAMTHFIKDQSIVLTYSRLMFCDSHLKPQKTNSAAKQILNGNLYFFNAPIIINHFVCFKKAVYEKTEKIDASKKIAEDQDLYLKMYEKGKVKFIDEINYHYRTHAGGISQNDNKKKSYEYWGKVIWEAMQRRGLRKIRGKQIPEQFTDSEEIFRLLDYQNSLLYRLRLKFLTLFS